MAVSLASLLNGPLLEPALLRAASRRASTLSDSARERMKPWVRAARARYLVVRELRSPESRGVALGLLRDAAFLALGALQLAESDSVEPALDNRTAWQRFSLRVPEGAPPEWSRVRDVFGESDVLLLDAQAANDAGELRAAAETTVAWLLSLAEVRSRRELQRARVWRSALGVAVLIAVVWALLSYWSALGELSVRAP